jgi:AcrR family transcriptional regulator
MARASSKVPVAKKSNGRGRGAVAAVGTEQPPDGEVFVGLSDHAIVEAARTIIAEVGVDGLTMRRLSAELGVALGATYHHVPTKHDLLVRVGVALYAEVGDLALDDAPWDETLRALMLRCGDVVARYPGMGNFLIANADEVPATDLNRIITDLLRSAGFSERGITAVMSAMFFYTTGMSAAGSSARSTRSFEGVDVQALFEEGLDLLLAGARSRLQDDRRARRRARWAR